MQGSNYSYLDFSVMPFARRKLISIQAAVLFDTDLENILWVNAAGAELFGSGKVIDLLSTQFGEGHPVIGQIKNAAQQVNSEEDIVRNIRVSHGLNTLILKANISQQILPNQEKAILLTAENLNPSKRYSEHVLAEHCVTSLDGFADASAIVDEFGLPIASSSKFNKIDVLPSVLENLVKETAGETDRLVKREITNELGAAIGAGIGRIHDVPARFIIVLAEMDNQIDDEPTVKHNEPTDIEYNIGQKVEAPELSLGSRQDEIANPPWEVESPSQSLTEEEEIQENAQPSLVDRWKLEDDKESFDEVTSTPEPEISEDQAPTDEKLEIADETPVSVEPPIRFAFSIGPDQCFRNISPELEQIVGKRSADVVGRSWSEIAQQYSFDENGAILGLLEKADTWSGKTILWPVENTDMAMPIDLAALPIFDKDRNFDGFRGFGIIRTSDAIIDADAKGMHIDELRDQKTELDQTSTEEEDADVWDDEFKPQDTADTPEKDVRQLGWKTDLQTAEQEEPFAEPKTADEPKYTNIVKLHQRTDTVESGPLEDGDNSNSSQEALSSREASAFVDIQKRLQSETGAASSVEHSSSDEINEFEKSALSHFDAPILVYRQDTTLFANQELLALAGYETLEELAQHGGISQLLNNGQFSDDQNLDHLQLRRKDGTLISVMPNLKKVDWEGTNALCLTFNPIDENAARSKSNTKDAPADVLDLSGISDLENILDIATDGILILDTNGHIESLNLSGEALFAKGQADVVGKDFIELFAAESRPTLSNYFNDLKDQTIPSLLNDGREVIGLEAKGGMIPMFVSLGSIGSSGKFCMVLRDLTSRKKNEEELVKAKRIAENSSEQKSDFLAQISHEIREPLNSILGFSDIMIEERFGPIDNPRYKEYLKDINRSGIHVLDLVNGLLDISKIEAGKLDLNYEAIDLNQLASETVALLQPKANSRRIIIRTSLSRAVPKVVADARSIRQIIMNLASNAIQHSPANSQVIVSTTFEENGEVGLRVRDTGNGMNAEQLVTALEPFSQVKSSADKTHGVNTGTGLGLPLTKALVEANRAFFELESTPGEGTIAYVQFPIQRVLAD